MTTCGTLNSLFEILQHTKEQLTIMLFLIKLFYHLLNCDLWTKHFIFNKHFMIWKNVDSTYIFIYLKNIIKY